MIKSLRRFALAGMLLLAASGYSQDKNFYIFLCLGQSNMEGFPGIPDEDKRWDNPRFQVLAAVDFPELNRTSGNWYTAIPPLCRPNSGLCPADYFGRTMVARLPASIRIGVVNVSVGGCKIELFDKRTNLAYISAAPAWMKSAISAYGGNPYQRLVDMGKLAQQAGVIRGILLHQGESNVNDPEWSAKVKSVYESLLTDLDLKAEDAPLIAGEVVDQHNAVASMNAMMSELPKIIPTAHIVSAAGCGSLPDHLHFTPEGYRELGKRYAEAVLPLLEHKQTDAK